MDIGALLNQGVQYIDKIVGGNEFASGAIIAGIGGAFLYICRAWPRYLYSQVIKHSTSSLTLNNSHISYHRVLEYLEGCGLARQARYLNIVTMSGKLPVASIGYGRQIFWWRWYFPLWIHVYKEDSTSSSVKEFISITKLGRSHKFFLQLIREAIEHHDRKDGTTIRVWCGNYEKALGTQAERTFDTLALPADTLRTLKRRIDVFIEKEEWYLEHHIPYQLGILLKGPSGTGKTSIIRAIAAYLQRDVCYVRTARDLEDAAQVVNESIIVAEEIDTLAFAKSRETSAVSKDIWESDSTCCEEREFQKFNLGGV